MRPWRRHVCRAKDAHPATVICFQRTPVLSCPLSILCPGWFPPFSCSLRRFVSNVCSVWQLPCTLCVAMPLLQKQRAGNCLLPPQTVWDRQVWESERLCRRVQGHSDHAPSRTTLPLPSLSEALLLLNTVPEGPGWFSLPHCLLQ